MWRVATVTGCSWYARLFSVKFTLPVLILLICDENNMEAITLYVNQGLLHVQCSFRLHILAGEIVLHYLYPKEWNLISLKGECALKQRTFRPVYVSSARCAQSLYKDNQIELKWNRIVYVAEPMLIISVQTIKLCSGVKMGWLLWSWLSLENQSVFYGMDVFKFFFYPQ